VNLKQFLFGLGVILQVFILGLTLYFFYDINQKRDDFSVEVYPNFEEVHSIELPYGDTNKGVKIPFKHYVTGNGKIKPSSDYVKINTSLSGIIENVFVQVGQKVTYNDPLFKVDASNLTYELRERQAEYKTALAQYNLLNKGPSLLELKIKEKEIEQIKLKQEQQKEKCQIFESLLMKNAVSATEKEEQDSIYQILTTDMEKVLVEFEQIKEPPSREAIEVGKAQIVEKEIIIQSIEKKLQDCQITSPISGKILSVDIHPGEYVDPSKEATIIIGSDDPLYLHVLIDDSDAWRVSPNKSLRAIAIHRSNPKIHFILDFVSTKPCLNSNKLELIFSFDKGKAPVYLEQNLDVYIEAAHQGDTSFLDYQFSQRGS